MLEALKATTAQINAVIQNDPFPDTVKPDYLRRAVKDYPSRGGKRLRPAILLWSCGLLGGEPDRALLAAAAVEIYHNWTLVHDDIIDNDDVRRGLPTTHRSLIDFTLEHFKADRDTAEKFGRDFAILAGDIQQGWAINMLLRSTERGVSPEVTLALARRLQEQVNRELISGEALDVEYPVRQLASVTPEEVETMLYLKTGAILRFCAEAGAAIALNDAQLQDPRIAQLGEFAAKAGIAFQLRDDWLGIFGDFAKFGKSIGSDLSEGKPTIMLLKTLQLLPPAEAEQLRAMLHRPEYSAEEIRRVQDWMRRSGAEKQVNDHAAELAARARAILSGFPDNSYRQLLEQLLSYLVDRDL